MGSACETFLADSKNTISTAIRRIFAETPVHLFWAVTSSPALSPDKVQVKSSQLRRDAQESQRICVWQRGKLHFWNQREMFHKSSPFYKQQFSEVSTLFANHSENPGILRVLRARPFFRWQLRVNRCNRCQVLRLKNADKIFVGIGVTQFAFTIPFCWNGCI